MREKAEVFLARTLCVWAVLKVSDLILCLGNYGRVLRKGGQGPTFFFFFLTSSLQSRCGPWIAEEIEQGWTEVMVPKS